MKLAVILIISFVSFCAAIGIPRKIVSTTVGRVSDHVVTSREVKINHLLEEALYNKNNVIKSSLALSDKDKFKKETTRVLMEWVVYLESKSFKGKSVEEAEFKLALSQVKKSLAKNLAWIQLKVEEPELNNMVSRKLQSKQFIKFRVKSSLIPITDQEARDYYDGNRPRFGNLPFENFKNNIKAFLRKKQTDQRLKDWFEVLQRKYKVAHFIVES